MRYTINLSTRIFLDHRRLNRLALFMIVLLLVVTGWNVIRLASNMGEQSRLKGEVNAVRNRNGAKPGGVSDADFSSQKTRIRFYNEIIERKSVNWLELLEIIEDSTPDGVSLSSLALDSKQDVWKLDGRARTFKSVQQYLEKLENSKNISNVLLLSHQNIASGDKGRGIQFSISCRVMR